MKAPIEAFVVAATSPLWVPLMVVAWAIGFAISAVKAVVRGKEGVE